MVGSGDHRARCLAVGHVAAANILHVVRSNAEKILAAVVVEGDQVTFSTVLRSSNRLCSEKRQQVWRPSNTPRNCTGHE
jgi:hypothetical protein